MEWGADLKVTSLAHHFLSLSLSFRFICLVVQSVKVLFGPGSHLVDQLCYIMCEHSGTHCDFNPINNPELC